MGNHTDHYLPLEHHTWKTFFYQRQQTINDVACLEFLDGLQQIDLQRNRIPDHQTISQKLYAKTGWIVKPTQGMIKHHDFFSLLAQRVYPVARKIRPLHMLEFYDHQEADLIHDYFGHCPLLMNEWFASFLHDFGQMAIKHSPEIQSIIELFFWFTFEFGLIDTKDGLRIYGAGILPSIAESRRVFEGKYSIISEFNPEQILKQSINATRMQSVYFVIKQYDQLYAMLDYNWEAISKSRLSYVA